MRSRHRIDSPSSDGQARRGGTILRAALAAFLFATLAASAAADNPHPHELAYMIYAADGMDRLVIVSKRQVKTVVPPASISAVAWSAGGHAVALIRATSATRQVVEVRTLRGERRTLLSAEPAATFYGVTWSPDSRSLALLAHDSHAEGLIETIDIRTLRRRIVARKVGTLGRIDWSQRGEIVVQTTRPHPLSRLALVDVATGKVRRVPGPNGRSATFSPDGNRLAYSAQHGIVVLELATGRLRQVTAGGWQDNEPAWSPDGTRLVYSHAYGHCFTPDPGPPCNYELFTVPAGGGTTVNVTRTPKKLERSPTWLR